MLIEMSRDEGRFLKAKAQILQQLGDIENIIVDAEAVVNELLDHGRTPAGPAEPCLDRPLLNEGSQCLFLARSQLRGAACGLFVRHAVEPIAAERADPVDHGLLMHP